MKKSVIVIGGGGHAKVLIDIISNYDFVELIGYTDLKVNGGYHERYLGKDDVILNYDKSTSILVNGIGSIGNPTKRVEIYNYFKENKYNFMNVIHHSAIVSSRTTLNEGSQIMAGTVIQSDSHIGINTIVNTRSSIDHDCYIGNHVHIAPGVTICGGVKIGDMAHIGPGATIIQNITLGDGCVVGAGAVVIHDVPKGKTVVGVPAKEAVF